jgi:hypothetical protein
MWCYTCATSSPLGQTHRWIGSPRHVRSSTSASSQLAPAAARSAYSRCGLFSLKSHVAPKPLYLIRISNILTVIVIKQFSSALYLAQWEVVIFFYNWRFYTSTVSAELFFVKFKRFCSVRVCLTLHEISKSRNKIIIPTN